MIEIWKDIEESTNYQVSNLGKIKRKPYVTKKIDGTIQSYKEKNCKIHNTGSGYNFVNLQIEKNKKRAFSVHRLVAKYFIRNCENKPEVNHIDGNKQNNSRYNLEWVTSSENQRHAVAMGLQKHTDSSRKKISESLKGIKRSNETRKKMSDSQKKRFKK